MATDLLSEALSLIHLTGALVFEVDLWGPCGVTSHPLVQRFAPMLPAGANQVIALHVVLAGGCWVRCGMRPWLQLARGHAIVVTRGDPHAICDRPGRTTQPFEDLVRGEALADLRHVRLGAAAGAPVRLLCGFLGCDRHAFDPLCGALPPVIEVDLAAQMGGLIRYAVANALDDTDGAAGLRRRLAELLLFVPMQK